MTAYDAEGREHDLGATQIMFQGQETGFLVAGSYDRRETASGIVRTVGGAAAISAPTPGVVQRVLVGEGQEVTFHQPLIVLDTGKASVGEAMRQRQEEILSMRHAVAQIQGEQARLLAQIDDHRSAVMQRPLALAQQRGQLLDEIGRDRRDRETLVQNAGYAILAPSRGVVSALQVSRCELVDPQRKLMEISNSDAKVSAELYVPSRAIGFVEVGQKVRVRYDAFPYQRYGSANATVRAISSTVLRPQDVNAAVKVEEPVYRVLVTLDRQEMIAYGRRYRIRPGFALTADVVLDRRNFLQWLFDPILASKDVV